MFRCITDLKALIIDIESFPDVDIRNWHALYDKFLCLFIVSDDQTANQIKEVYANCATYKTEGFMKLFAPSPLSHFKMIEILQVKATEAAYVSADISFLNNAMGFLGGTIWVTNSLNYEEASRSPDLVCKSFNMMSRVLLEDVKGFLGEVAVYPGPEARGMIIPVGFEISGGIVPLYILGRYFGYSHYMNQLHPYSAAIALNKKEGRAYYRKFDEIFSRLYIRAVKQIQSVAQISGIVSVPTRPGDTDRFDKIRDAVSQRCGIEDLQSHFKCTRNYPSQKSLSSLERQANIEGVFQCDDGLSRKNIVIIDDIITTGSTMKECVRELKNHGVSKTYIIALAVNQVQGAYWAADSVQVSCISCGGKMNLLVNSNTKEFFYSCYNCRRTLSFEDGRTRLYDCVNAESESVNT